ncbi:hypothetical protein GGR26_000851 [Lewinella marina]|nr:hypothetical protein [Neolewinella marina]
MLRGVDVGDPVAGLLEAVTDEGAGQSLTDDEVVDGDVIV